MDDLLRSILPSPVKAPLRRIYYGTFDLLRSLVRIFMQVVAKLIGKKRFLKLSHFIQREIDSTLAVDGIVFDATNYIPFTRAVSILTKEPDTIAWIQDFVEENGVFYDIGANVGVFSLYAAIKKKATVYSFEPFAANYAILNHNIFLNRQDRRITALNIAAHGKTALSYLNVSEFWAGKAGHSFGDAIGSNGDAYTPKFRQGAIGMSLDDFIRNFDAPFPNYIKIDVDGNEHHVVEGMKGILLDSRLKSIAVELNNNLTHHRMVIEKIKSHGFKILDDEKYLNRTYLKQANVQNYFFIR